MMDIVYVFISKLHPPTKTAVESCRKNKLVHLEIRFCLDSKHTRAYACVRGVELKVD